MPKIFKRVESLVDDLKRTRVGLAGKPFIVDEFKSGSFAQTDDCDRFRLSFQIADNSVNWEIIFDKNSPQHPPDIVFGSEDEEFSIPLENLKGYYDWDPASDSSLSKLLLNVLREYWLFQREKLSSVSGINEQWRDICTTTNYARACEVYYSNSGMSTLNAIASFIFELTVDVSDFPPHLVRGNTGEYNALLKISFQPPNLTKVAPKLYLSSRMEHAIGGIGMLSLPPYEACDLRSYVEKVDLLLSNTVNGISERFTRRKELVATFLAEFHGAIIEYDAEGCSNISLLLHEGGIFIILHAKGPLRRVYEDYRYSPRWTSRVVVNEIRTFIGSVIPEFQTYSSKYGKLI